MSVANVKLLIDMIVTAMSSIRLLLPETAGTAAALHAAVLSSPLPAVFAERFDCLSSLVPKPHLECIAALRPDQQLLPVPPALSALPEKCAANQKRFLL